MPLDRNGDPWSGKTYKGFSDGPAAQPKPPPRSISTRKRRNLIIGGVGVAVALGLGLVLGVLVRREFGGWEPFVVQTAAQPANLAPPRAERVPIAINPSPAPEPPPQAQGGLQTLPPPPPPLPPTTPSTQGRLETLPPEMAAATQSQARPPVELSPIPVAPQVAPQATPTPAPAPVSNVATPDVAPAPEPRQIASFDCAAAASGAEQMVCSDPQLAAADRQLARAYRRALRSGVDPTELAQEQKDWVAIREDAARQSPRAVAQVYEQRIAELNQIADGAPAGNVPGPDGPE